MLIRYQLTPTNSSISRNCSPFPKGENDFNSLLRKRRVREDLNFSSSGMLSTNGLGSIVDKAEEAIRDHLPAGAHPPGIFRGSEDTIIPVLSA